MATPRRCPTCGAPILDGAARTDDIEAHLEDLTAWIEEVRTELLDRLEELRTKEDAEPSGPTSDEEPYAYTRLEAAAVLRVSTRTIDRLITDGTVTSAKIGGRVLIPAATLRRLIDDHAERLT